MTAGPALVLGATGFVGREVVAQLAARGTQTVAHVRPDSKQLADWRAKFAALGATVDDAPWAVEPMAAHIRDLAPTVVFILIGTTRHKAKADAVEGNIYEAVDYGLTKLAVDAALASGTKPRIVYLSSLGADPSARSAYLAWRGKAEGAVTSSGLPWMIARPAIITGDRGADARFGESAGAVVGDALLSVASLFGAKRARAKYASTSPPILAAALLRLADAPDHDRVADGAALRAP